MPDGAAEESLYEKVLGRLAVRGESLPVPRPPRASAAVVLWRRSPDGALEVFWIRRSPELSFMGGWHAFPGGVVHRSDAAIELVGEPREGAQEAVAGQPESLAGEVAGLGPALAPGVAACAVRELFEETGILLAAGPTPDVPRTERARRRLLDGEVSFGAILRRLELAADAAPLVYAGRWLTPPLGPLRFDTRFFLLEWTADGALGPQVHPGEIAEAEWVEPHRALARWHRGEVLAAPPILHLLRVLAEDGPQGGLDRLRSPSEANLGPFRRIEFLPGVILLPLATATLPPASHTNCYLVGRGEALLVDPGTTDEREIERLLRALEAARRSLGRTVTEIWLTHHHPDHVGGVERLRAALDVPVAAHPASADRLAGRGIAVDRRLGDGERRSLAGEPPMLVEVLHTPGHARGHLCFGLDLPGATLVGDLVSGVGTVVIDPPEGAMDDYLASLERLAGADPGVLLPGHGPAIYDGEGKLRELVAHRLWREERVLAAWRSGVHEPVAIVDRAYDDIDAALRPLAERQVVAHLERLRAHRQLG